MRQRRAGMAAAIAACAMVASPAAAATPRQTGTFAFTSTSPGHVTGNTAHVDFVNPADPNGKPYAVDQMIVHIPRGTVMDTTVPPQCHATDAEIYAFGFAACPSDTQIGWGQAVADNGPGGDPNSRYPTTTLQHYNNQGEVVGIGQLDQIPVVHTIDRTKLTKSTSTSTFPVFPGFPPPEPYTPVKELTITFPPYSRDGRAYTRTPRRCPAVGYWTFVVDFKYRDGVTESIESHSPCVRGR